MPRLLLPSLALSLLASSVALAQFSSDPSVNLAVGGGAGDQIQPKIVRTSDGGSWISWFDNAAGGYDVRVQRLDGAGNPLLAPGGVLVADRNESSTQDYGLTVDSSDNAYLAFNTDRYGGDRIQAHKISPAGSLDWGVDGRVFASARDFNASPRIAVATDDAVVVAWTRNSEVRCVRFDSAGNSLWNPSIALTSSLNLSLCDLQPGENGSVIVSYIEQGGFTSPRHLFAQELDAAGLLTWGSSGLPIFDSGSIQFGNFPSFITDGAGGAIFSWYDAGTFALQCYVQRLRADGAEVYPHNGVAVANNGSNVRVSPSAAYDNTTGDIYVFWTEEDSSQGSRGVSGQRIDSSGNRLWGNAGRVVKPLTNLADYQVDTRLVASDALVMFSESLSFGNDTIHAARLNPSGSFVWSPQTIIDISSTPASKFRLASAAGADAQESVLVWEDTGSGDADALAQNVNGDGSLGTGPRLRIAISGTCPNQQTVTVTGATPGNLVTLVLGAGDSAVIPPGFICAGTALQVGPPQLRYTRVHADKGGNATLRARLPQSLCGLMNLQALDESTCAVSNVLTP